MTSTGLLIGPLGFLIILLPWRFSIAALLVLATLDSAAVFNIGAFGLQPGYFFGLLVVGRTLIEIVTLGTPFNAQVVRLLTPLLLFTLISFVSIWVGLTFFQGKVMVMSGTAGLNLDLAQPYSFQRQNLTQPFYLLLNVAIVYALAHQVARLPVDRVAIVLEGAAVCAILFASLVALWELAGFYAGVPFFADFFHSNLSYASAYGQILRGGIFRVSGPFSEPSDLAYHFAGFLLCAWYRYLQRQSVSSMALVLLCLAIMAASTSTTAFAVFAVFALVVVKDLGIAACTARTRIRFSIHQLGVLALLGGAAFGVALFIQSQWTLVDSVVTRMLFEKAQSSSFAERSGVDMMALDIVLQTGGIGIGLGSHKPNNLALTLLSNTGIAGFLVFALFLFELLRPRPGTRPGLDLRPYRWMILGLLSVHLISNPNLNPVILWVGFGLLSGALANGRGTVTAGVPAGPVRPAEPPTTAPGTPWVPAAGWAAGGESRYQLPPPSGGEPRP